MLSLYDIATILFIIFIGFLSFISISIIVAAHHKQQTDQSLPSDLLYRKWQVMISEIGLREVRSNEPHSNVVGEYRNHEIEVRYYPRGDETGESIGFFVEFENPFHIEMSIGGHHSLRDSDYSNRVRIDDYFDRVFSVYGNKEDYIREVLNPDVQAQLLGLREEAIYLRVETVDDEEKWRLQAISVESFQDMKKNPERFRHILGALINLAENIEKGAPLALARERDYERWRKEVFASGMQAAILSILEKSRSLSYLEIEEELESIGFNMKGVEGLQILQRLVQEGKVYKTFGERRVMEYSIKK